MLLTVITRPSHPRVSVRWTQWQLASELNTSLIRLVNIIIVKIVQDKKIFFPSWHFLIKYYCCAPETWCWVLHLPEAIEEAEVNKEIFLNYQEVMKETCKERSVTQIKGIIGLGRFTLLPPLEPCFGNKSREWPLFSYFLKASKRFKFFLIFYENWLPYNLVILACLLATPVCVGECNLSYGIRLSVGESNKSFVRKIHLSWGICIWGKFYIIDRFKMIQTPKQERNFIFDWIFSTMREGGSEVREVGRLNTH